MTEVIMPKMGDGMEEGTLLEWLKQDGEKVRMGEIIGTIQTDKATLELEAPGSGVLSGLLIQPGATVPVGHPIAALLKEGESLPLEWGSGQVASASYLAEVPDPADRSSSATPGAPERVRASPLAKKIAAELGVSLGEISGSGPGGRITEGDVRSAAAAGGSHKGVSDSGPAPMKTPSAPAANVSVTAQDAKVPLSRLRQIIAQRTGHSKQTVPHFYVTVEVDLDKIQLLREVFEEESSGKVSVNDFVVKASALALQEMPEVNASFAGDHVVRYGAVHVGIAAAVEDGLVVPVIKDAHVKSLRQLSAEARELVKRARDGKLLPDEMSGSTFCISNMGMLNVDSFGAIINEPNAAIVAIGTARKKAVVFEETDEVEVRWRMNITGSFDHRVVDGAIGAAFVNKIREYLENPTRVLA